MRHLQCSDSGSLRQWMYLVALKINEEQPTFQTRRLAPKEWMKREIGKTKERKKTKGVGIRVVRMAKFLQKCEKMVKFWRSWPWRNSSFWLHKEKSSIFCIFMYWNKKNHVKKYDLGFSKKYFLMKRQKTVFGFGEIIKRIWRYFDFVDLAILVR